MSEGNDNDYNTVQIQREREREWVEMHGDVIYTNILYPARIVILSLLKVSAAVCGLRAG